MAEGKIKDPDPPGANSKGASNKKMTLGTLTVKKENGNPLNKEYDLIYFNNHGHAFKKKDDVSFDIQDLNSGGGQPLKIAFNVKKIGG